MAGAIEVRAFEVTCQPGVTFDDPQVTDLDMPVRTVNSIRVRIPPGPLSAMGFQIGMANTPILPFNDDSFVVADNETFEWSNQDWPDSGAWQVFMYNNGQYPHTIYLYFTVEQPDPQPVGSAAQPIPAASLGPPTPVASAVPTTSALTTVGSGP
jgi:hypothetical protein